MLAISNLHLIIVAAVIGAVAFIIVTLTLREKRARKNYLSTRSSMPDSDFLAQLNTSPDQHATCLAVRRAVAKIAEVPPETLSPSESVRELVRLGLSIGDLFLVLEDELPGEIDVDEIAKIVPDSPDPSTLADLIDFVLAHPEFIK